MNFRIYHYKLINVVLLVSFVLSRLSDYTITYIMLLLGCKEGNWLVNLSVNKFGNLKGLAIAAIPALIFVAIVMHFVIKYNDVRQQQFAAFVLIMIIFYSIVVTLGNLSGFALVIHTIKG